MITLADVIVATRMNSTVRHWFTLCCTVFVSGSTAAAAAAPPTNAPQGTRERSVSTMTSSPPQRVFVAWPPSQRSSSRSRNAANRPAARVIPATR